MSKHCNGICISGWEVGVHWGGIAYPHPECELHGWPDADEELPGESLPYDIGEEPHSWGKEEGLVS